MRAAVRSALLVALLLQRTASSLVAVIGATGKVGRHAVRQLVEQGHQVRCMVRHDASGQPNAGKDASPAEVAAYLAEMPGVELVRGDVEDRKSVMDLLKGCSACLAVFGAVRRTKFTDVFPWVDDTQEPGHAKQVNYEGVRNIIEAARASGTCKRIVRITGKGETPFQPLSILINGLGSMAKAWNQEGERLLRDCKDVEYTIIRPGFMGDVDAKLEDADLTLGDNGADLKVTAIPHRCVAELCVRSLGFPNAARTTLCAMTVPRGEGEASWEPLLSKVSADTRAFPGSDLLESHYLAVRVGGLLLSGFAAGLLAGASSLLRTVFP
mmetsp:Transcript_69707/g.204016  ORF Transcript_69707/g.204016 Transcript_69707/m.204016 type:complete len:325 (+) Transcript_69707:107-1081(+)